MLLLQPVIQYFANVGEARTGLLFSDLEQRWSSRSRSQFGTGSFVNGANLWKHSSTNLLFSRFAYFAGKRNAFDADQPRGEQACTVLRAASLFVCQHDRHH